MWYLCSIDAIRIAGVHFLDEACLGDEVQFRTTGDCVDRDDDKYIIALCTSLIVLCLRCTIVCVMLYQDMYIIYVSLNMGVAMRIVNVHFL